MKIKLIILLVISLVLVSGCVTNLDMLKKEIYNKSIIKNNLLNEDPLTSQCKEDLNYYYGIARKKFGYSLSFIEIKKVENLEEAKEFNYLYGSILSSNMDIMGQDSYYTKKLEYPLVLFAVKMSGEGGELPFVLVCENNGKLTKATQSVLLVNVQL